MKLVIVILLVLAMSPFTVTFPTPRTSPRLARITNIYIPQRQPDSFRQSLTRALTKAGFCVVTDPSQADAVLTVLFPQFDVIDDRNMPKKWVIKFELAFPNNKVMWKYRVETLFDHLDENFDEAAMKMAAKLLKDKETSVRKTRS